MGREFGGAFEAADAAVDDGACGHEGLAAVDDIGAETGGDGLAHARAGGIDLDVEADVEEESGWQSDALDRKSVV